MGRLNKNKPLFHGIVTCDNNHPEVVIKTPSGGLAERSNRKTGGFIKIPSKILECIKYWNSFPELTTHKIENTSTMKSIVRLLRAFFSGDGKFLKMVYVPENFANHEWFDHKSTVKDFKELVDDFIYCIRTPGIRPLHEGKQKFSLLIFLAGLDTVGKNENNITVPSMMLLYCFGPYKTVQLDKYPRRTQAIKEMWTKYVGKFMDTPESEKAFVSVSALCVMRYQQKREEDPDWTPSMGDYQPEGIAKQIILEKKDWFIRERKKPEFMGNGYFSNLIRRYDYDRKTGVKTIG